MKKSLLLGAALTMAAGAMAQIEPGEYYIKNVETGMFLNEGASWATHGVVRAEPLPIEVSYIKPADDDNAWRLLGAEDNVVPFFSERSQQVDLSGDGTIHWEFYNYNSGNGNLYDNWILVITNGIPFGAEGYSEYLVLRADAYGWGTAYNHDNDKDKLKSDYDWDTFVKEMNGALVNIDVTRTGTEVEVMAKMKAVDGTERYESITLSGVDAEPMGSFLTLENSHLLINPEVFGATPAPQETGYLFKSPAGYVKTDADGPWMDGGRSNTKLVALEAVGNDAYTIDFGGQYLTVGDPQNYLGYIPLNLVNFTSEADGDKSAWQFLTREEMIASLAVATPENPVNASFLLNAASIEYATNAYSQASWKYVKNGQPAEIVIADTSWDGLGDWDTRTAYGWCLNDGSEGAIEGTDVVSQEIEGVPAGNYEAVYRVVNQSNTPLVININGVEGAPYEYEESDLWYKSAWYALAENTNTVNFTVGEDGKLSVRMEKTINPAEQNRFAFKSFSLSYLGKNSGVANIATDENAPVEYFNLQGIRVAEPADGIFIKRQGKKVSKVVL